MTWKQLPKTDISKEDIQKTALYGLYLIIVLSIVSWFIR
jgi:hypothetical protein